MNNINEFLKNHGCKIILVLLIMLYLKTCSVDRSITRLKKEVSNGLVETKEMIKALPNKNDLKIEGLNAEKRMIQATDRRMLDVQRQSEIDNEIKKLESQVE